MNRTTIGLALAFSALSFAALAQSTTPQTPAATEERAKVREACAADVQKFCSGVERTKGAMRTCLETNTSQLSDACKAARAERAAARAKQKS